MLDLINPDPAPAASGDAEATVGGGLESGMVEVAGGRRIRSWVTVLECHRALQCNDCEVTYETIESDGTTRRLTETFPFRSCSATNSCTFSLVVGSVSWPCTATTTALRTLMNRLG